RETRGEYRKSARRTVKENRQGEPSRRTVGVPTPLLDAFPRRPSSTVLALYRSGESRRVRREARKDRGHVRGAQMAGEHFAEQVAEVRGHREVAALEAARRIETRPAPEAAPAAHGSAHHQHGGGVAVVRADVAVLADRAAELGHREHHDVAQLLPEVLREGREPLTQLGQARGQLPLARALIDVGVPPRDVRERDLQAQVSLDELLDLLPRPPEPA